jgi:gliding motility-associated protein GldE
LETETINTLSNLSAEQSNLFFLGINTSFTLILTLFFLFLSASATAAEVAYFSLTRSDLEGMKKDNQKNHLRIMAHLSQPEWLLGTLLVANIFVNVAMVITGTLLLTNSMFKQLSPLPLFLFEAGLIALVILFFGEILPKMFASRYRVPVALTMAYPLKAIKLLLTPLTFLLVNSTGVVSKRLARKGKNLSLDELSHALELSSNGYSEEKEMLEGIVKFGNLYVEEIMTSRVNVVDVDIRTDFNTVIDLIVESGYSRIPVYENTPDNVKGILYVKDLLPFLNEDKNFEWQSVIRQAYYVPESKKINDLLSEFQSKKIHMAIVVDEYGGTSGIVTLEDILEEIVGDISDETDEDEITFSKLPDGSFVFEGKTLLNDFYKITETDETEFEMARGDAETLAGLILELKGEIPKKNETIDFFGHLFTIIAADNRKIKKVKFVKCKN